MDSPARESRRIAAYNSTLDLGCTSATSSRRAHQRGVWARFGADLLLGYEYRACIKLGVEVPDDPAEAIAQAYQRVCMEDLRTLTEVGLYGYHQVPPQHRLWIWETDLEQVRKDLPISS